MTTANDPPGADRRRSVPRWAVSPRSTVRTAERREGPQRVANRDAAVIAALRAGAGRIAEGDRELLPALGPAVATSARGLTPSGGHYLPANRLDWWGAAPWKSRPISRKGPTGTEELPGDSNDAFLCEFNPLLATVVGTDVVGGNTPGALLPFHRIPWDETPGISPNAVPDIGFTVRAGGPSSTPTIAQVPIRFGSEMSTVDRNVLVNAFAEGFQPDSSLQRADLILDFDVPQRAVGLEFAWGRIGDEEHPWVVDVELELRSSDGTILDLTDPTDQDERNDAKPLADFDTGAGWSRFEDGWIRYIGARDQLGRISTAALRFKRVRSFDTLPPDAPPHPYIVGPQLLYRVWYEPLPGVVVKQDQVEFRRDSTGAVTASGSTTMSLPFGCDRAIAFLRGFRTEFPEHREIWGLDVGVEAQVDAASRSVTVLVTGPSRVDLLEAPFTNRMYYTLLAWDSRQVELTTSTRQARIAQPEDEDEIAWGALDAPDPCPDAPPDVGAETLRRCGPVVVLLSGFAFEFPETCELDRLTFRSAEAFRHVPAGHSAVRWPLSATVSGDGEQPSVLVQGRILSGRGLRPYAEPPRFDAEGHEVFVQPINVPRVGYRTDGTFALDEPEFMFFDRDGDMAFVALRYVSMVPGDEIRQIDVEVKAKNYDGQRLTWAVGTGVATENDGTERHGVVAYPAAAAVVRRNRFGGPRLEVQGVRWANTSPGTRSGSAVRYGVVRNTGDLLAIITDVGGEGPHAGEFHFVYDYRGQIIDEDDFPARLPLMLRPGESLTVGGYFFPAGSGSRQASLLFTTNDRNSQTVVLPALGETAAADPAFAWAGHINFGNIQVGSRHTKRALLVSSGTTALVVNQIAIESPLMGFSVAALSQPMQLDPGDSWVITVAVHPTAPGVLKTNIIVETNAGQGKFPVQATALRGPVTLPPIDAPGRPEGGPGRR